MKRFSLVLAVWLAAAPAAAACPKTSLGDIEDEVMCPVCGTSLELASEAPQAERQRAFIERLIADCESKQEVKAALVDEFGEEVLAVPGDDGFEIAAYLIPAAILLGAGGAIAAGVRRWRRSGGGPPGRSGESDAAGPSRAAAAGGDSKRLDDDLAKYDL